MLSVSDLAVSYGAIKAVKGISFDIDEGEIVTLIGANGAGKSTTLRTISGLLKPKTGAIDFQGQDIAGVPAHEIVKRGISQVPEGRRIFAEMTVRENLDLGAFTRKDKDGIAADLRHVFELFPRLEERRDQVAGTLSFNPRLSLVSCCFLRPCGPSCIRMERIPSRATALLCQVSSPELKAVFSSSVRAFSIS